MTDVYFKIFTSDIMCTKYTQSRRCVLNTERKKKKINKSSDESQRVEKKRSKKKKERLKIIICGNN